MKICTKCNIEKDDECFSFQRINSRRAQCKDCVYKIRKRKPVKQRDNCQPSKLLLDVYEPELHNKLNKLWKVKR